ncbi:hypothetical protein A2U01_0116782, partial [Trifolium medium]|nr:hypothetical protein [Trifolium medium]
ILAPLVPFMSGHGGLGGLDWLKDSLVSVLPQW